MRPSSKEKPTSPPKRRARASRQDKIPADRLREQGSIGLKIDTPAMTELRQQLEEAERHYQALYDSSPVGYVTLDHRALIRKVNLTAARLLEFDRDQLFDLPFTFLVPSEDLNCFLAHLRRCRAGADRAITDLRLRTKKLELIPVRLLSTPLTESYRTVYRTAVIDLREGFQKTAPESVGDVAEALCDAIRQPVALVDSELAARRVNDAFAQLFPSAAQNPRGRSIFSLMDPSCDDRALREQLAGALLARRNVEDFLLECELPQRGRRFLRLDARWLTDDSKQAPLILITLEDLTGHVQQEQQALRHEELLNDLLQNTPVALHCTSPEGQIVWANRAELDLLGYTAEEYVHRPLRDFHENPAVVDDIFRRLLNQETVPDWESRVRCKDGSFKHLLIYSNALWQNGRLIHVRCGSVDLTPRVKAEESIKGLNEELKERIQTRTADLRKSYHELDAFCYAIAHDLRAPLRAIEGFGHALLEDYGDTLDETARDYTQRVIAAAEREDHLIQDLITYTQLKLAPVSVTPVSLGEIVSASLEKLTAEIQQTSAQIEVDGTLPAVLGHASILERILIHLFRNALKFVDQDTTPKIHVSAEQRGSMVRLWIEDNGIGIAPEHHERIFQVFERLHPKNVYAGTGIGLSIVRKGVERMEGQVGVESTLGEGSRFWIELNAA